ncbi:MULTISPECIES: type VI secretion system protein TssA [unclassified Duganella]|uniref:type VI secretion system protein TssA n=1 Tax=unclassified Duganella TaxID=2636909 RepID=UPI000E34C5EF|nr:MULTISPECIES: type VI secretion system protein TssA [unclassified Duganella]RFP18369.1 type VI secretion system protein TssA [Duganella sp. BJB475]RFP35035.1 type VI secretion system protein TssA [Duganella sp. BJB476]
MFSIVQLLQPISAAQPCGEDVAFSAEVDQIAQARVHDDPTLDQGEWISALREADWPLVASRSAGMIASRSKDMRLAVWLAEAFAKTRGLRGLGDGYAVLSGLCEHYWDGMYPGADDGDYEQRIGNLFWLLARTPPLVKEMPLTEGAALLPDAEYCLAMLTGLEGIVDQRLGAEGPGFSAAKDCLLAVIRSVAPVGSVPILAAAGDAPAGQVAVVASGTPQDRRQALAQLRVVADFFRRTEPHSPVAYLADKAASWGDMPLHVWLRAVIKDPAAISRVEELLGAQTASE